MKKQNNRQTTFPIDLRLESKADKVLIYGMSLRDYFAASALQGIANLPSVGPGKWHQWADEWAAWSYSVADAMLVERAKKRKQP